MLLRDQQQRQIVSRRAAANTAGFAFNVEDQVHSGRAPVEVQTEVVFAEPCLHVHPLSVERLQRRITGLIWRNHARVQPLAGSIEIAKDGAVTLRGGQKKVRIQLANRSASRQQLRTLDVIRALGKGGFQIPLRQLILTKFESGTSNSRQSVRVVPIGFQRLPVK